MGKKERDFLFIQPVHAWRGGRFIEANIEMDVNR